jgi:hypothetical protein
VTAFESRLTNLGEDTPKISAYTAGGHSYHVDSVCAERLVSQLIGSAPISVDRAVNFDHQLRFVAVEVRDVAVQHNLRVEMSRRDMTLQRLGELAFGRCLATPKQVGSGILVARRATEASASASMLTDLVAVLRGLGGRERARVLAPGGGGALADLRHRCMLAVAVTAAHRHTVPAS